MGLPTVFFFDQGVFGEYDDWAGTISLVVFGLAESILFAWVFGIDRGWEEINRGADLKVPNIYKPILKYVTPTLLLIIFMASLFKPMDNDWGRAFSEGWELDPGSIIGKITNKKFVANTDYFSDTYEAEANGTVSAIKLEGGIARIALSNSVTFAKDASGKVRPYTPDMGSLTTFDSTVVTASYTIPNTESIVVNKGDQVSVGSPIAKGDYTHTIFYNVLSKIILLLLFGGICGLVYIAYVQRQHNSN
jgi:hypothetical protein